MFSGELTDLRTVWATRRGDMLVGALNGITATSLLVSPRLSPIFLALTVLAWFWLRSLDTDLRSAFPEPDALCGSLLALLVYVFASTFWAAHIGAGIPKVLLLIAVTFAAVVVSRLVFMADRTQILCAAEGLWIGLLVGVTYFLVEGLTGQGLKIWVINTFQISPSLLQPEKAYQWAGGKLVRIDLASFTRSTTPISLLVWSACMAALGTIVRPWNKFIALLLVALAVFAIFFSPQESSKVSILVGLVGFGVAWLSLRWAYRLIATVWVVACLAVVPAVLLAHKLDLHNARWIQPSAQHRIIIWNFTAQEVMKSPIFGIGAYMTYVMGPEITAAQTEKDPTDRYKTKLSRHSHNAYLQTWLEFGAIGALLFMGAGLQVLSRIRRFAPAAQPFAFATFSSAAALLASSYGIWQTWYLALFGLTVIFLAVGARAFSPDSRESPESVPMARGRGEAPRPVA